MKVPKRLGESKSMLDQVDVGHGLGWHRLAVSGTWCIAMPGISAYPEGKLSFAFVMHLYLGREGQVCTSSLTCAL